MRGRGAVGTGKFAVPRAAGADRVLKWLRSDDVLNVTTDGEVVVG
jgi:hypothetical protein